MISRNTCRACFLNVVVKQFLFRSKLREAIQSVGGSTETFSEFVADGGAGDAQIRVIQSVAEASGIAGHRALELE